MIKWINKKRNKKGFTLIELIVVIAILGILAAIAIPRLMGFQETAKISADKATLATLNSAIAVGVANGDIPAGTTVTVKTVGEGDSATGVLDVSYTADKVKSTFVLLESGASFKLDANFPKTITWVIDANGVIESAPTIADDGEINKS